MTIKVKVLIVCAAVVVVGGAAAAVGITLTKEDTYRVLKVFEMSGETTVTREGSGELAAYVGMNLESGDLISVGEGSTIRLSLDGDKYIQLDELTVLELEASGTKTDSRTVIKLKEGTILNEITNPLSENSVYEVATPKATMAVRGTSFSVTVTKDAEGRYIITENTYQGKVEATLLDETGAKTSKVALVNADRSITICTSPNSETGNPAEIDGTSVFVIYDTETGEMQIVPDGEDPTHEIDYELISAIVKEYALRSNDTNLMTLDENVVKKLRGKGQNTASAAASEPIATTAPPQTEPAETTVPESTVSEVTEEPINSDNTDNVFTTAAPPAEELPADTEASKLAPPEESATTASTTIAEESTTTAGTTTAAAATTAENTTTAEATTTAANTTTTANTTVEKPTTTAPTTTQKPTTTAPTTTQKPTTTAPITTQKPTTTAPITTQSPTTTVPSVTEPAQTTAATTAPEEETQPSETSETEATTEEEESFVVSFECDGKIIDVVPAESGDSLYDIASSVAVPAKDGKTGVWKIDGKTAVTSDMTVKKNITLTAVYSANAYTITFTADGADEAAPQPVEAFYGDSLYDIVSACAVPAKAGNTGVWKIDGKTAVTADMTVTGNMTIAAVYTVNKYTVTFTAPGADDGAVIPAAAEYDYGTLISKIVPAAVPTKTGHTGTWKIDGTTDITADAILDKNITLTAVYDPVKYTITYTAPQADDQTTVPAPAEAEYGSLLKDAALAAIPAKAGHTGVWKIDGTTAVTDEMTVTGDVTLTAVYTINKYTVTFTAPEADDPTDVPDPIEVEYGALLKEYVTAEVPVKTGSTGEWKIDGLYAIDSTVSVSEDVTVTAVYDKYKYTITFTADEADDQTTVPQPITAEYGDDLYDLVSSIAVPKQAGNDGVWKIDGTTEITSPYPIHDDITVSAVYTARTYVNINYNFNGTTGTVQGNSGEYLKSSIIPNKIQQETYANDLMNPYVWLTYNNSWSADGNSEADKVDSGMTVTDYVIKQDEVEVWSEKKHTISYTAGSSTGQFYLADNESILYIYGGFLDDILNGYTGFVYNNGEKVTEFTTTTTVSADTTITAYQYKVTLHDPTDGTAYDYFFNDGETFNGRYGSMPAPNANSGYHADKWFYSDASYNITFVDGDTPITSSMDLDPYQLPDVYNLTFSISGTPTSETAGINDAILTKAPSLDGTSFTTWYISGTSTAVTAGTTVQSLVNDGVISITTENITLIAS